WVAPARVAPTRVRVAPTRVRVAPTRVRVAPTRVRVAPTRVRVAPAARRTLLPVTRAVAPGVIRLRWTARSIVCLRHRRPGPGPARCTTDQLRSDLRGVPISTHAKRSKLTRA